VIAIRLAFDQGVPLDAATLLRKAGYDCIHVSEAGMHRAEDAQILKWARELDSVIVTLDADFHAMMAVSGARAPSVVRLRIQGLNGEAVAGLVQTVLGEFGSELSNGCLISVKAKKTTCHTLPIIVQS
jgi:predicted nuclease of predicted toxin-antitoxin system